MSSQIKEIYDRLIPEELAKSGRHYEVLAAFVWKLLDQSSAVVHDITIRAPGHETANQIDVHVSSDEGERRRVIIECRDKEPDATDPKIGQDEARSFATVAAQLRRDPEDPLTDAIMLTTVGYTKGAQDVSRDEGLTLAVLEPANVLREIHLELRAQAMGTPQITGWLWRDDAELERLRQQVGSKQYRLYQQADEAFFYDAQRRVAGSYRDVLEPVFNGLSLDVGDNSGQYEFDRLLWVELEPGVFACVRGFEYRVEVSEAVDHRIIRLAREADVIAELVLRSLDGSLPERAITAGELRGLERAADGEIRPRARE